MDRDIQNDIEDYLHLRHHAGSDPARNARLSDLRQRIEQSGPETRRGIAQIEDSAELLLALRPSAGAAPDPGFYARVMERVDAQRQSSIWSLFGNTEFGRRLAMASAALLILLGVTLMTTEPVEAPLLAQDAIPEMIMAEPEPAEAMTVSEPESRDQTLVQLATYEE